MNVTNSFRLFLITATIFVIVQRFGPNSFPYLFSYLTDDDVDMALPKPWFDFETAEARGYPVFSILRKDCLKAVSLAQYEPVPKNFSYLLPNNETLSLDTPPPSSSTPPESSLEPPYSSDVPCARRPMWDNTDAPLRPSNNVFSHSDAHHY
eukprot:PhF_6_TR30168/c0_g3_i1/m.44248